MSADCSAASSRLEAYLADRLSADDRRAVRRHLASCDACGAHARSLDPALLFAFAEPAEVSEREAREILESVQSAIAWRQAERRLAPAPRRGPAKGLAAAAALVALLLALPGGRARTPAGGSAAERRHAAVRGSGDRIVPAARPGESSSSFPADATIYDWNPGGGSPRVVWIVDASLDI